MFVCSLASMIADAVRASVDRAPSLPLTGLLYSTTRRPDLAGASRINCIYAAPSERGTMAAEPSQRAQCMCMAPAGPRFHPAAQLTRHQLVHDDGHLQVRVGHIQERRHVVGGARRAIDVDRHIRDLVAARAGHADGAQHARQAGQPVGGAGGDEDAVGLDGTDVPRALNLPLRVLACRWRAAHKTTTSFQVRSYVPTN